MATHYRKEGRDEWKKIDDDIDLKEFGLQKLHEMDGQDCDGDYSEYIEFDRDNVRTYIAGYYYSYSDDHYNTLQAYDYGTEESVNEFLNMYRYHDRVERNKFNPNRDWIKLDKFSPVKWPRGI